MLIAIHSAKGGCQAASKATRRLSVKQSHIPHYFIFSSIIPKWLESSMLTRSQLILAKDSVCDSYVFSYDSYTVTH